MMSAPAPTAMPSRKRTLKRSARRTVRRICMWIPYCSCCICTSLGGVLQLMRSETTQEMALAVVIGNAFDTYCTSFSNDIVGPTLRMIMTFTENWHFGCLSSCTGFLLVGGERYPLNVTHTLFDETAIPYLSVQEAIDDGAKVLNITSAINSTIAFVLTLLNIYWFFGLITKTEVAEKYVTGVYERVKDTGQAAAVNAANKAGIDARRLRMLQSTQLDSMASIDVPASAAEDSAAAHIANAMASAAEPSLSIPQKIRNKYSLPPAAAQPPVVMPFGAFGNNSSEWLKSVDGARSVEEGMRALHQADPLTFFMHGDAIRAMLSLKLNNFHGAGTSAVQRTTSFPLGGGARGAGEEEHGRRRRKKRPETEAQVVCM